MSWKTISRKVAAATVFTAVVVALLMWLAGAFHRKIGEGGGARKVVNGAVRRVGGAETGPVRLIRLPREESSVGTIEAVHQTSVASKLLAKVLEVRVSAGQGVGADEILVRLDDVDLQARLQQAQAAAASARAQRDQAQIEYARVEGLRRQEAASSIEWERVQTGLRSGEAELARAEEAVREAETVAGYATIRAPMAGIVIEKRVEAGDMVVPGQALLSLYDPGRMQLVAQVRESLTHRLAVGQMVDVYVAALQKRCQGRVSEIVPEAQASSRTFSVKVTGPCPPGIYSGMFGRLLIPLDDEEALVVPQAAIHRVGQLNLVDVAEAGIRRRRTVQLGRVLGDDVEILAGLRAGEVVVLGPAVSGGAGEP